MITLTFDTIDEYNGYMASHRGRKVNELPKPAPLPTPKTVPSANMVYADSTLMDDQRRGAGVKSPYRLLIESLLPGQVAVFPDNQGTYTPPNGEQTVSHQQKRCAALAYNISIATGKVFSTQICKDDIHVTRLT